MRSWAAWRWRRCSPSSSCRRCMSPGSGSGCRSSRQGRSKSRCRPPTSSDQLESCPCPASGTGWPTSTVVPGRSPNWGRWARAELGTRDAYRPTPSECNGSAHWCAGGTASLLAAIYTQRYQDRLQRIAREIAKREMVYADFITNASRLLLKAQVRDEIKLGGDEQQLIGLTDRMRLFAPPKVINEAEAVIRAIVEIWLQPSVDPRQLAEAALSNTRLPDPLV